MCSRSTEELDSARTLRSHSTAWRGPSSAWGSRSEERRVGKEWRCGRDWSSDVCSSDLETFAEVGDPYGVINTVANNSWLSYFCGDYAAALQSGQDVLTFYRRAGQRPNTAIALDCMARAELGMGQ